MASPRSQAQPAPVPPAQLSSQVLQQRPGVPEVGGVKPLVTRRRSGPAGPCGVLFPLALPQPPQAHCRARFVRFDLLLPGDLQGLEQIGFCLSLLVSAARCPRSRREADTARPRRTGPSWRIMAHASASTVSRPLAGRGARAARPAVPAGGPEPRAEGPEHSRPWCTWAIPASPWPCAASAHP